MGSEVSAARRMFSLPCYPGKSQKNGGRRDVHQLPLSKNWGMFCLFPGSALCRHPPRERGARATLSLRQRELILFQFLQPPGEKTAFRFFLRQGERLLVRSTGLRNPP